MLNNLRLVVCPNCERAFYTFSLEKLMAILPEFDFPAHLALTCPECGGELKAMDEAESKEE